MTNYFYKSEELHTINDWNIYSCSSLLFHIVFKSDINILSIGNFLAADRNSESIEELISISWKDRVGVIQDIMNWKCSNKS